MNYGQSLSIIPNLTDANGVATVVNGLSYNVSLIGGENGADIGPKSF